MTKEMDQLLEISSFSTSIEKIYKILEGLEKKGQKDSEEYKQYVDLIGAAREIEAKKYRQIDNVFSDAVIDYKSLILDLNRLESEDELLNVLKMSTRSNKVKRLFAHLRDIALLRNEEPPMNEEEIDILEGQDIIVKLMGLSFRIPASQASKLGIDIPAKREQIKSQKEEERKQRELTSDILYNKLGLINAIFYEYLTKYIDTCKNKSVRNKLITYKYQLLFTTPTLEAHFIKGRSGKPFYETMIELTEEQHSDELYYLYSLDLIEQVNNAVAEIAQANYSSSASTIDEKVANILKVLYTKSLVSSIIEETDIDYLKMASSAAQLSYESDDDLKNVKEVFNTDELVRIRALNRKKVD